jgi:DNA-directed RNA polymerase omega subunit
MIEPPLEELLKNFEGNRYLLVSAAAKRAIKIASGEKKLINTEDTRPVNVALEEIKENKIKILREKEIKEEEK